MRGFVVITVVEVKCGRKIIDNTIMKSVLDVMKKYAVDVVLRKLAVSAMKQIAGVVECTQYLSLKGYSVDRIMIRICGAFRTS